jgi:hypothetical protein
VHARAEDACWNKADERADSKHFEGDGGEGCAEVDEPVGEEGRYADAGEVEQEVVFVVRDGRVQRLGGREVGGEVERWGRKGAGKGRIVKCLKQMLSSEEFQDGKDGGAGGGLGQQEAAAGAGGGGCDGDQCCQRHGVRGAEHKVEKRGA